MCCEITHENPCKKCKKDIDLLTLGVLKQHTSFYSVSDYQLWYVKEPFQCECQAS